LKKTEWQDSKFFGLAIREYRAVQKKLLQLLDGVKGTRFLDVGCFDGQFTIACASIIQSSDIYGLEIKEQMAQEARKKGVKVVVGDAGWGFPFATGYFDVVMANQILEHVLNVDTMLSECYRVLRNSGMMLLAVPNLCSLPQRVLVLFGYQPTVLHVSEIQVGNFLRGVEVSSEHLHAFAPPALEDLLKYHHFRIEKICGSGFYPLPSVFSRLASRLFPKMAVYLIVRVKKETK
jgi:SAM-dependent methyltransferase